MKVDINFFIAEVKRLCKARNILMKDFMKMMGKGVSLWHSWRVHQTFPNMEDFVKICELLEVSMEHFFQDDSIQKIPHNLTNVFKTLPLLSQEEREELNKLSLTQWKAIASIFTEKSSNNVDDVAKYPSENDL